MDQLRSIPTRELPGVIMPTVAIYAPLLNANADKIKSVPKQTFSYGSNPRQKLDVFLPPVNPSKGRRTVLVFFYGGGMINGARTLPVPPLNGLVYSNLAAYFALNHGYTVVIPDYRLLGGQHGDFKFPDGGEDVGLAVQWVTQNPSLVGADNSGADVFVLANSAGGAHATTYLFEEQLAQLRATVLSASDVAQPVLRGFALLGVPYAFDKAGEGLRKVYESYYGPGQVDKRAPLGLFDSALKHNQNKPDFVTAGVKVIAIDSELDPEALCVQPKKEFVEAWRKSLGDDLLEEYTIPGHNHISPPLALSTGRKEDEAWAARVASWIEGVKS